MTTLTRPLPTKALSIRQPWAWLIVNGHKDIENRTWASRFRGPVLIHAACVPPERRTSRWHMEGCHGFALRAAQPLPFTPLAGRLGFFDVPADVLSQIIQNQ